MQTSKGYVCIILVSKQVSSGANVDNGLEFGLECVVYEETDIRSGYFSEGLEKLRCRTAPIVKTVLR